LHRIKRRASKGASLIKLKTPPKKGAGGKQMNKQDTRTAAEILTAVNERLTEEPQTDDGADFVAEYSASDSAYICDAFSEFADGRTSIYNSDIKKFMCENPDAVEDALNEFGFDGCGNDFYKLGQTAEYLQIERALYNDMVGIIQALAREYLENVILEQDYNGDKLADALEELADALENIDNNNRLDDIADAVNDFLKALTDEDGEQ
jgi:hypothetical protein